MTEVDFTALRSRCKLRAANQAVGAGTRPASSPIDARAGGHDLRALPVGGVEAVEVVEGIAPG
ncbi:MAG: hypothetical protein ACLQGP_19885 [Isosphaeraceae bacterium]